jgi:peptide/nickel transport system permease protein
VRFLLRRLGFFLLTLWAALTLNFFLPRLMPGNPALAMMGKFRGPVSGPALKALEVAFGVNTHRSLISQYFSYIGDVATGKFGTSLYFYPESVGRVVLDAIPWTLGLVGVTTVLAFILGTGVGAAAASRTASCRRSS